MQLPKSGTRLIRSTISKSWKIVLGGITLTATSVGIASGYLSFLPRITVAQNQALDPSDPFSTPFVVSNEGPLGINDVNFSCLLKNVETVHKNGFSGVGVSSPATDIKGMEVGERTTLSCVFSSFFKLQPGDSITEADIVLQSDFRSDFVVWNTHRDFRFRTVKGSDGRLYFYPFAYDRTPEAEADRAKAKAALQH